MSDYDSQSIAIDYATQRGFAVFPTYGIRESVTGGLECTCGNITCGSQGKHPAVSKGLKAASKDPSTIENLWAGRTDRNIAIATGIESGIFVVDVDGEAGLASQAELPKLPKTLTCKTARGFHYYFRYPDKKVYNRTHVWKGIDIRGEGGYVIGPPSHHVLGLRYEWLDEYAPIADAPDWLLEAVCSERRAPVVQNDLLTTAAEREWTPDEVRDMLSYLSPDCSYQEWVDIGMALQAGGYNAEMYDEWSRGSAKYKTNEPYRKWYSFEPSGGITMGTLIERAKLFGWKPREYISETIDWESHPANGFFRKYGIGPYDADSEEETDEAAPQLEKAKWPTGLELDPMQIDGLVGDTVRWIVGCAYREQPELALLNTLAALGAVFGRRYAGPTDLRTNLFCCGIAGTGAGKDESRKRLKALMLAAGMETYLAGEDVKSGAGLVTQMERQPSCVMMIDEFGLVIASITGKNAAQHHIDISTKMLSIYSTSGSSQTFGGYADKKVTPTTLYDPNLCIYGCTTLDKYLEAIKKDSVESGFLNRFITLNGRTIEIVKINDADLDKSIPDSLLEAWKGLIAGGLEGLNTNSILGDPIRVEWGNCREYVRGLVNIERDMIINNQKLGNLCSRYRENVMKVASIFAICDNPERPVYDLQRHMIPAQIIVKSSLDYIIDLCENNMYENEYQRTRNVILMDVKRRKRGISRRDLKRMHPHVKSKDFDQILSALMEEEYIRTRQDKKKGSKGRPTVMYVAI